MIEEAQRPLLYVGGGAVSAGAQEALNAIAQRHRIPVTTTLMGKGVFDENDPLAVGMLGMHGTAYANFAVTDCDLLIAVGARFDDRVTGKLDTFAPRAKVIHFEIDPAEVGKNRKPDVAVLGDVRRSLEELLQQSQQRHVEPHTAAWLARIESWKQNYPLTTPPPKGRSIPRKCCSPFAIWRRRPGSPPMWGSTRCGRRSTCAAARGNG